MDVGLVKKVRLGLEKKRMMKTSIDYFPMLASEKVDKRKILKEYNKSMMSKDHDMILPRFFILSLMGKIGNYPERDRLFRRLNELSDREIVFSINDYCFNHYSICTMVRSSLFNNILNDVQSNWFSEKISQSIWALENPFSVKYFVLEDESFDKKFLIKLFNTYKLLLPTEIETISIFNLKREFFRLKLKSPYKSILDIAYLFKLGDKSPTYFHEL